MFYVWYLILVVCSVSSSSNIDCGKGKFPCDTGNQCVERKKWCDEHPDCTDKSDEAYCETAWFFSKDPNDCNSKTDTHLHCGSGICIPIAAECDEVKDCDDGFDERHCAKAKNETETYEVPPFVKPIETSNEDKISSETSSKDKISSETSSKDKISSETSNKDEISSETSNEDKISSEALNKDKISSETSNEDEISSKTSNEDTFSKEAKSTINTIPSTNIKFPKTTDPNGNKQELASKPSITLDADSSKGNGYRSVDDYYGKRMREANSETKPEIPLPSFPKQIPTRTHPLTPSMVFPTQRTTISTTTQRTTTQKTTRSVSSRRPSVNVPRSKVTSEPGTIDQQRQSAYQHTNYYQPPINHYQLPTNRYQPSTNNQPRTSRYQPPSSNYQNPSQSYQSSSNHYRSPNHRTPNRQHDVPLQTNYFKPYRTELEIRRPFYFGKNYGSLYGQDNAQSLHDGRQWLLGQRSGSSDWGKDTPRAVVALALSSNDSFLNNNDSYEIIKRRFMVQLGVDILKNNTNGLNVNKLFMAINGLLAVCEDPTDFHGVDLTAMLRRTMRESSKSYQNPFVYLSLCLSNKSLTTSEIHNLISRMHPSDNMNERTKDLLISSIMAFSCYIHQSSSEYSNYGTSLRSKLREAVTGLIDHVSEDGSFGSVYSTALAAQALMSTNESSSWDVEKTLSFLRQQQLEDGSFGDLLATYWVLPALNGKSLLHLRNLNCHPTKRELTPKEILEFAGPKHYVNYFLYFGYPIVNSQSQLLFVPQGIHFLDVMRVAEYQDPNFRFVLEKNSTNVYSMSGLPNDPELGLSWHFYVKQESNLHLQEPNIRERHIGDLRRLTPKSDENFVFWYHSNDIY